MTAFILVGVVLLLIAWLMRRQAQRQIGPSLSGRILYTDTEAHREILISDRYNLSGRPDYILEEHGELITAESRHRVTASHAAQQSLRGLHQQRVTGGVAQVVVDHFEVVDIHRQDRQRTLVAMIKRDRVIKPITEQDPVGQVGQRVA